MGAIKFTGNIKQMIYHGTNFILHPMRQHEKCHGKPIGQITFTIKWPSHYRKLTNTEGDGGTRKPTCSSYLVDKPLPNLLSQQNSINLPNKAIQLLGQIAELTQHE